MKMKKIKIISASSPESLNSKIEEMIAEGWEPIGSHSAVNLHSQNRYAGSQHMDTIHKTEYSITMGKLDLNDDCDHSFVDINNDGEERCRKCGIANSN